MGLGAHNFPDAFGSLGFPLHTRSFVVLNIPTQTEELTLLMMSHKCEDGSACCKPSPLISLPLSKTEQALSCLRALAWTDAGPVTPHLPSKSYSWYRPTSRPQVSQVVPPRQHSPPTVCTVWICCYCHGCCHLTAVLVCLALATKPRTTGIRVSSVYSFIPAPSVMPRT